jgi:hypothetical protein
MRNAASLSDEILVARFARLAKARGEATLDLDNRVANRLFDQMKAIGDELRARGTTARLSITPLLNDEDRFVRYYAAIYLLRLVPDKARAILEWNAKYGADSIAADARMGLRMLDEGTYRPD